MKTKKGCDSLRIKGLIRRLTYEPKHAKPTDENIFQLLLPSMIGMVICLICLIGMTWAWFTASITTSPQTITAANYEVSVSIDDGDVSAKGGQYTLSEGEHKVTLTAKGNASTGYCKIKIDDETYYTPQFPDPKANDSSKTFAFSVKVSEKTTMTVRPIWGTYTDEDVVDGTLLENGALLDLSGTTSDEKEQTEAAPPQGEKLDAAGEPEESAPATDKPATKPDEPVAEPPQETEDITPPASGSEPSDAEPSAGEGAPQEEQGSQ